jgi:hypothetical protein
VIAALPAGVAIGVTGTLLATESRGTARQRAVALVASPDKSRVAVAIWCRVGSAANARLPRRRRSTLGIQRFPLFFPMWLRRHALIHA